MSKRTTISMILFCVTVVAFLAILYQFWVNPDSKKDVPLLLLLGTFGFLVVSDRLCSLLTDIVSDNEYKQVRENLERFPGLLAGRHDVVTFSNALDTLKYCLAVCPLAIEVKNTVLRYGIRNSVSPYSELYSQWLSTKKKSIDSSCPWTEIVSAHLCNSDPQVKFIEQVNTGVSRYQISYIDDAEKPMIQMTIFTFKDGSKEILFGHEFANMRQGVAFLTRNREIINYFESYFAHWFSLGDDVANRNSMPKQAPC